MSSLILTAVRWDVGPLEAKVWGLAKKGLLLAAEHVLEQANRIVPHDTGALQSSGEASVATHDLISAVSYGDSNVQYAVWLHEHPDLHFREGRQGKWLEKTIHEQEQKSLEIVAAAIRGAFEK